MDNYEEYVDKIINSVKAEELNAEETGVLMKNMPVATGTIDVKVGKSTVTLSNVYSKILANDSTAMYTDSLSGVAVTISKSAARCATFGRLQGVMQEVEKTIKSEKMPKF